MRLVEEETWPGDITILKAVSWFGGQTQTEDKFMVFSLKLGAWFVPGGFLRCGGGAAVGTDGG